LSFPYCVRCLSDIHGLRVGISTIPGAGLGPFVEKSFSRHVFDMEYGGKHMSQDEYKELSSRTDQEATYKNLYVFDIKKGQ
jgi:hypothetical protein